MQVYKSFTAPERDATGARIPLASSLSRRFKKEDRVPLTPRSAAAELVRPVLQHTDTVGCTCQWHVQPLFCALPRAIHGTKRHHKHVLQRCASHGRCILVVLLSCLAPPLPRLVAARRLSFAAIARAPQFTLCVRCSLSGSLF